MQKGRSFVKVIPRSAENTHAQQEPTRWSAALHLQFFTALHACGINICSTRRASWDRMNRQYLVLAQAQQWWVMGLVETAGRAHCYSAPEEWDSWKSPCPAAPQTEPCWLSSEATWWHGERPADSWGTARCHGNRGSSRVSPGQAKGWTTELLWVRVSAQQNISLHFKKCREKTVLQEMNTPTSNWLDVAGFQFVQICQKHWYQDQPISRLAFECITGLRTCDSTADIQIKTRAFVTHIVWPPGMSQELYNGCIL